MGFDNDKQRQIMIGTLTYKMTLRPYMKPLLFVAAMTNWHWLTDICFKKEIVAEGAKVELNG